MSQEVERRTTSRRAVVRGGAWVVPAISVAAAAPAYAVSNDGWIDDYFADTAVTPNQDGSWDLVFLGASLFLEDRGVLPNQLTVTLTMNPPQEFVVHPGGPQGWTQQPGGTATSVTYAYGLAAPANSVVPISDGSWVSTVPALGGDNYFQAVLTAPGFHMTTVNFNDVPTSRLLAFDPGTSSALRVPDPAGSGPDLWAMYVEGASVRVSGWAVTDVDLLRITVTFVPDPGVSQRGFLDTGSSPAGWSTPGEPNPHQQLVFSYDGTVDASTQDVVLPLTDGAYFTTMLPADEQSGYFQLTVSDVDDAFASAIYRIHVPAL